MYKSLFNILATYWKDYGGLKEWLHSPFVHFSLLITLLHMSGIVKLDWEKTATGSLPTVLGFSLAAYTITFTLMGSALHRALSSALDNNSGTPLIRQVNATFFHVVLFQSVSLLYSTVTSGDFFWKVLGRHPGFYNLKSALLWATYYIGDAIGCFLVIYSLFLLFSVGLAMYRLGRLSGRAAGLVAAPHPTKEARQDNDHPITRTWRFALVRGIAKALRLYE